MAQCLVDNAIKFTTNGYIYIDLVAEDATGMLRLTVADTGKGVASNKAERIFERFFRIDAASSTDYRDDVGSGLGLSVVRNAVQFHGGQISALIPPEGGLEFDFTLKRKSVIA